MFKAASPLPPPPRAASGEEPRVNNGDASPPQVVPQQENRLCQVGGASRSVCCVYPPETYCIWTRPRSRSHELWCPTIDFDIPRPEFRLRVDDIASFHQQLPAGGGLPPIAS